MTLLPRPPLPKAITAFPVILMAVIMQYVWAVSLLVDDATKWTTSIHGLMDVIPANFLIPALLATASSSIGSFYLRHKLATCFALLPQQMLLLASAAGAVIAVHNGAFFDGIERSHGYILIDQLAIILMPIVHFWSIILVYRYTEDIRDGI